MPLETGEFINDLVPTNPLGTDPKAQGDDHLRLTKKVVQQSFPNIDAEVLATPVEFNSWEARIAALETPTLFAGAITAFAMGTDPLSSAWLYCDGSAVLRTGDNAVLFAAIGETYGNGDGATTFNLPDYRGRFLRAQDDGAGRDPDAAGRTDRGDGTGGDNVGSIQADEVESHTHGSAGDHTNTVRVRSGSNSGSTSVERESQSAQQNAGVPTLSAGAHTHSSVGGNENRPVNAYVRYYIHL